MKFNLCHLRIVPEAILWIVLILLISGCNSDSKNKLWPLSKLNSKTENRLTKDYLNYITSISSSDFPINLFQSDSGFLCNSELCARIGTNPDLAYFPSTLWQIYSVNNQPDWKKYAINYSNVFEGIDSSKIFFNGENIQNLLLTPYLISGSQKNYSATMSSLKNYLEESGYKLEEGSSTVHENAMSISKMLETQLLLFASDETGDPIYKDLALKKSEIIIKRYFRDLRKEKFQIMNCIFLTDSCQISDNLKIAYSELAIALYGFAILHRETGIEKYNVLFQNIASLFLLNYNENGEKSSELLDSSKSKLDLVTQSLVCLAFINKGNQVDNKYRNISKNIFNHILADLESEDRGIEDSLSFRLFYYLFDYERLKQSEEMAEKS